MTTTRGEGADTVDMSTIMNWVFGIFGVTGTVYSIYSELSRRKTERENKSLSWEELMAGTRDLFKDISRSNFVPDIIFTPNLRGGIIAHLIVDQFDKHIPVFVGQIFWKELSGAVPEIPMHTSIVTGKWILYIPQAMLGLSDKRLLIVDDFSMTGDTLQKVKEVLQAANFSEVKTASLVTTTTAVAGNKSTDFKWRVNKDNDFYFPWGKAK